MGLYMVELRLDLSALLRFLADQGLRTHHGDDDLGYGVHAWLTAGFGELTPKPWRLFIDGRRPPRVLAYACHDAAELRQRLREFADPAVFAVCADPDLAITSRIMPSWSAGRRLSFEVQCCPIGRRSRTGSEEDIYLIRAGQAGHQGLRREAVYCDWVREQLERDHASHVNAIQVQHIRMVRQTRRVQGSGDPRPLRHLVRPRALLRGELTVIDPDAFAARISRGVGRHRAFGYGMILLRPPSGTWDRLSSN